ncbi:MAG: DUF6128 domain-containing protein [Blautia sp.]|nr:DUF6128 domain-containing protein [Blautia sp.]
MVDNNYYERKIKYLDLMENGERTGGAGFIKTEVRGMDINLTIVVKGLHPTDTYEREVMLQAGDGESALGRIALKGGQGEFRYHTVMDHSQLRGIRIVLDGVREICCKWQEEKRSSAAKRNIAQPDIAQENAAQESGHQDHGPSDNAARDVEAEKQRKAKKPREIQLIPWDEIKAVEESLERVDKMMSKPAESSAWRAAERGMPENIERELAEQGMPGNAERVSAKWGMSENIERKAAEQGVPGNAKGEPASDTGMSGNVNREPASDTGVPGNVNREPASDTGVPRNVERELALDTGVPGSVERKSAERGISGNIERGPMDTGVSGNAERELATEWATQRNRTEREAAESMNGETFTRKRITEEPTAQGTRAGEPFREKADGKPSAQEMRTGRSTVQGKITDEPSSWERMPGEAATRGRMDEETAALERMSAKEKRMGETAAGAKPPGNRTARQGRIGVNQTRTGGRSMNMENRTSIRNPERRTERPAQRTSSGNSLEQKRKPVRLMEDKWQQIWAIYPHIHPFQDEREYLSISPADFVLLPDEAYRAANNSFLLHGYYNYDHLILTRIEKRGEVSYYIGVPGNYYEREKQVAIMFGFESFECGTEPAQAGDFGYYMMRTQL